MKRSWNMMVRVSMLLFPIVMLSCARDDHESASSGKIANSENSECRQLDINVSVVELPELFEAEQDGRTVLVDESGDLWHYLIPPRASIYMEDSCAYVSAEIPLPFHRIMPKGGDDYDGFDVTCSAFVYAGRKPVEFSFGPEGGSFKLPKQLTKCEVSAYIIDAVGNKYKPVNYTFRYYYRSAYHQD